MGVLLALRRLGDPEIARFLNDPDPRLVLEAARAINDVPIAAAMPALAALPITSSTPLPLLRRVLNANFRLGRAEHAAALAEAAGRPDFPAPRASWPWRCWPSGPDRRAATRSWGSGGRSRRGRAEPAAEALRPRLAAILSAAPATVRTAAVIAAAALGIKEAGPHLAALAADRDQSDRTRAEALKALDQLNDPGRVDAARRAADLARARGPAPRRSGCSPRPIPPRRSRRFRTGSSTARRPSGKGRSPSWPPCPATRPAQSCSAGSTS